MRSPRRSIVSISSIVCGISRHSLDLFVNLGTINFVCGLNSEMNSNPDSQFVVFVICQRADTVPPDGLTLPRNPDPAPPPT